MYVESQGRTLHVGQQGKEVMISVGRKTREENSVNAFDILLTPSQASIVATALKEHGNDARKAGR